MFKKQMAWLREQIGWDRQLIADRQSGTTADFVIHNHGRENVTDSSIRDAEARIARNEKLVDPYEKRDA